MKVAKHKIKLFMFSIHNSAPVLGIVFLLKLALHIDVLLMSAWGTVERSLVEEVSMKWMDRPCLTEMERGGVYEMERRKKCKKTYGIWRMYMIWDMKNIYVPLWDPGFIKIQEE